MKKTCESGKLISNRPPVQRRISNQLHKPGTSQELTSEVFLPAQSDIAKKVQVKLRVRRATGSQKKIGKQQVQQLNGTDKMLEDVDLSEEFEHRLNYLWENSEEVGTALNAWSSVVSPQEMRKKISKQWALLQCQVQSQDMEDVVVGRVAKIGQMARIAKRCCEQEELVGRKFEQRMKKLGQQLISR